VVALNHFSHDTEAELQLVQAHMERLGVAVQVARHWAEGGRGAEALARAVVSLVEQAPPAPEPRPYLYADDAPLLTKVETIAQRLYGAAGVSASHKVRAQIHRLEAEGHGHYPVCVAKTQYSFSTDPMARGAPSGHVLNIREVRLAAGAEFVVMICGDVMTMPGLPKVPAAERIDVDDAGRVVGLF
jgi:formate--tetrahydrofolate ligase